MNKLNLKKKFKLTYNIYDFNVNLILHSLSL
jgi:hypothetical protein